MNIFSLPVKSRRGPSERTLEIEYGKEFFNIKDKNVCEIGAVLRHWGIQSDHEVVDISEKGPNIINMDAIDVDYMDKNVICISTIEHMGRVTIYNNMFEFGNADPEKPMKVFKKIVDQSKSFYITWPIGYCGDLDQFFLENHAEYNYLLYMTEGDGSDEWVLADNMAGFKNLRYVIGDRFNVKNGLIIVYKI
jgi:hypothetical protein